ncbi:MAG: ABC transporter permease [Candidatus Limnocylindrales bacterium]
MSALSAAQPGLAVLQHNMWVYRRTWRGSIFSSFLTPVLFLLAMGLGIGTLVGGRGSSGGGLPGGVSYVAFLAPGLMAGAAMQTASFESTFRTMIGIEWRKGFHAMLATPLRVWDVLFGELGYLGFRLLTIATAFFVVMVAFGVPRGPLAVLAIPAAVLTGFAFGPLIIAFSATLKGNTNGFNMLFRFVIMPLYLFSGTFFPIEQLPVALRAVAWLSPLYHGVALSRDLTLGSGDAVLSAAHLAVLVGFAAVGVVLAQRNMSRRLVT